MTPKKHLIRALAFFLGVGVAISLYFFIDKTIRTDKCPTPQVISAGELPAEITTLGSRFANWHMLERCGQGITIGLLLSAPLPDVQDIPNLEIMNQEATQIDLNNLSADLRPRYDEALKRNSHTIDLVRLLVPSASVKVYALPDSLTPDDFKDGATELMQTMRVDIILNGVADVAFNTPTNRAALETFISESKNVLWLHTAGQYEKDNYIWLRRQNDYYALQADQVPADANLTPRPEVFVIAIPDDPALIPPADKLSLTITGSNNAMTTCQVEIQQEILHIWPDDALSNCNPSNTQFMATSSSLKLELQLLTVGTYDLQIFGQDLSFDTFTIDKFIPSPNNLQVDHSLSVGREGASGRADLAVPGLLKTQLYPLAYAGGIAALYYQEIQPLFPPSEQAKSIVKLAQMLRDGNKLGRLEVQPIQSSRYVADVLILCFLVMGFTIIIWRQIKKAAAEDRYAHGFGLGVAFVTACYIYQNLYNQITIEPILIGISIFLGPALLIGFFVLSGFISIGQASQVTRELIIGICNKLGIPVPPSLLDKNFYRGNSPSSPNEATSASSQTTSEASDESIGIPS